MVGKWDLSGDLNCNMGEEKVGIKRTTVHRQTSPASGSFTEGHLDPKVLGYPPAGGCKGTSPMKYRIFS